MIQKLLKQSCWRWAFMDQCSYGICFKFSRNKQGKHALRKELSDVELEKRKVQDRKNAANAAAKQRTRPQSDKGKDGHGKAASTSGRER